MGFPYSSTSIISLSQTIFYNHDSSHTCRRVYDAIGKLSFLRIILYPGIVFFDPWRQICPGVGIYLKYHILKIEWAEVERFDLFQYILSRTTQRKDKYFLFLIERNTSNLFIVVFVWVSHLSIFYKLSDGCHRIFLCIWFKIVVATDFS